MCPLRTFNETKRRQLSPTTAGFAELAETDVTVPLREDRPEAPLFIDRHFVDRLARQGASPQASRS